MLLGAMLDASIKGSIAVVSRITGSWAAGIASTRPHAVAICLRSSALAFRRRRLLHKHPHSRLPHALAAGLRFIGDFWSGDLSLAGIYVCVGCTNLDP